METDRKLINYLPQFMQEFMEMQKVMEAEQPEIDLLWNAADNALADQFILEATEYGVERWESMLGISPKDTDSLDERKFRILTMVNQELPFTMQKVEQALTNLCGADGFSITLNAAEYKINVKLALSNENNRGEVEKILHKMIPANLVKSIVIMYNPNFVLMQFTHAQLSAYTHEQLKSEVFD